MKLSCHPIPNSEFATVTCDCGRLHMTWIEFRIAPKQAALLGFDKCTDLRLDRGRPIRVVCGEDYPLDENSLFLRYAVCRDCRTIGPGMVIEHAA